MKLNMKKIVIIIGVMVLIVIVLALIKYYPIFLMKPAPTGKVQDAGVVVIKDGVVNMYAIQSGEEYILIDVGSNAGNIEKALAQENIPPENVSHIFLTHSDADHVGAIGLFPNALVYMSENELQMVNGEITDGKNNRNSKLKTVGLEKIILLTDNQEIVIGEYHIKCISVPGHTPGSMAYVVNGDYLFSGDGFRVEQNKLSLSPFTRDEQSSIDSIYLLSKTIEGTKITFTGHYGYYESAMLEVE